MTDTAHTAPPAVLPTRQPDTRAVPLGALKNPTPIRSAAAAPPDTPGALAVAAFNSSL